MLGTIYESDYHREHLQNTVDNLNLLYVAFTRACHSLFVIGKRNAKNSRSMLIEQVLPLIAEEKSDLTLPGIEATITNPMRLLVWHTDPQNESHHKDTQSLNNPFLAENSPHLSIDINTFSNPVSFRQSNRSKDFIANKTKKTKNSNSGNISRPVASSIRFFPLSAPLPISMAPCNNSSRKASSTMTITPSTRLPRCSVAVSHIRRLLTGSLIVGHSSTSVPSSR